LSTRLPSPKQSEIWLVNFDPTIGAEIKKIRPAVVISADHIGRLPIKLVSPITDWKDHYARYIWLVRIDPDSDNSLSKTSAIDTFQLRGVSLQRFIHKVGCVSETKMREIVIAIGDVVDYP
jgi:mRNA interferase MazF